MGATCWWDRFAFEWSLIGAIAARNALVCRMRRAAPAVVDR